MKELAREVYRNFATLHPSEELVDDLTDRSDFREILKGLYYSDFPPSPSPIASPIERVLQKSANQIIKEEIDSKFNPGRWLETRYSDGTWAVLYTAESEETALREALFHMREFYQEELRRGEVLAHRRVVSLYVQSDRCLDLFSEKDLDHSALTSKDRSGYSYCQQLAKAAIEQGTALLRAPSARDPQGVTVPVFKKEAIQKDGGHLKFLRCLLRQDGRSEVTGIIEEETQIL